MESCTKAQWRTHFKPTRFAALDKKSQLQFDAHSHPFLENFFLSAPQIFCFKPRGFELSVQTVLGGYLTKVGYPRVELQNPRRLRFFKTRSPKDFTLGYGKILEPQAHPSMEIKNQSKQDVILVPSLCLDRHGHRVGSGMGMYDRFLSTFRGIKIGICPAHRVVEEISDPQDHDVVMDWIYTEQGEVEPR